MRNFFINKLTEKAKTNKKIFLIVGDVGFSVVEEFADKFPKRFLNVGIAEQNMMGIAAGLASEGMHVFVYSIANFPTFRCAEQIRNDVDYHKLPVTIVSIGGGFSYGNLGYSHHAIQDYGLIRLMPNMLICSPGDITETSGVVDYITNNPQPSYLRLDKSFNEKIRENERKIIPGEWVSLKNSKNGRTFLTTGNTLRYYKKIFNIKKYKDYGLYSLPIWGQKHKDKQNKFVRKFKKIITIEDHLQDAGFGSWIREASINNTKTIIENIALNNQHLSEVGNQYFLNKKSGLFFE